MPEHLSLGFRVKSGFAIAVVLSGPKSSQQVLARRVMPLSDASVESTRQPYHGGFGTAQEDLKEIARLTAIIKRCARQSVKELLADPMFAGRSCRKAGVVVGSVIDPATVGNQHIRAHANEGRLFRTVLEEALTRRGLLGSGAAAVVATALPTPAAAARSVHDGYDAVVVGAGFAGLEMSQISNPL